MDHYHDYPFENLYTDCLRLVWGDYDTLESNGISYHVKYLENGLR